MVLPDVQVQQDLLLVLTRMNFDSYDAQWLEREEFLRERKRRGGVTPAPLDPPPPPAIPCYFLLPLLSFVHTYLFTQFHSGKCKRL